MSIFTKAAGALQRVMRFGSSYSNWSMLMLGTNKFDYAGASDARANSVVMACVLWICRTFPEAPLQVMEKAPDGTEKELVDHDFTALLANPNPYYSGELLWNATLADWTTDGNAYWCKIRNRYGTPVQLWWIPQAMLTPVWPVGDPTVYIDHYAYAVGGGEAEAIPVADIVHFRNGLDPANTRKGLSPLASLMREVYTDDEAASFSASLLRNMGMPGVIISPEADDITMSSDDVKATKTEFKNKFSGENRGEPMVMSGKANVQILSFNPQQMDLKALRRLPEERVSAVLGVPAIVAGLGAGLDRSTFANMAEARAMAYESNIIPNQRLFAADLRTQLLSDFGDIRRLRVAFDLRNVRVLQDDQSKLWTRVSAAFSAGLITRQRGKELIGEKAGAGDDVYFVPTSIVEEGPDAPPPEPLFAQTTPVVAPVVEAAAVPVAPPAADNAPAPVKASAGPEDAKAKRSNVRLVRKFGRQADALSKAFAHDLDGAFADLGDSLSITFGKSGKASKSVISGDMADGSIVRVRIPTDPAGSLKTIYEANYGLILEATSATIADMLSLPVGVNMEDPRARELIRKWATRKGLADINQQTRDAIMQALADGRAAGEGADDLAFRIRGMVEGRSMYPGIYQEAHDLAIANGASEKYASQEGDRAARQYRATNISRSETKTAQNNSAVETYLDSEVVDGVIVYDGTDDDDECREANGQIWTFEQALENPIQHVRCVRSFAPNVRKTVQ